MDMKHLELSESEWLRIRDQIRTEHGDSMILLRDKMRRELGFTVRRHQEWRERAVPKRDVGHKTMYPVNIICLDFYDESAKSWFVLKYL